MGLHVSRPSFGLLVKQKAASSETGENFHRLAVVAQGPAKEKRGGGGRRRTKKPCRREQRIRTPARTPHQMDQTLISSFTTASIVDRTSWSLVLLHLDSWFYVFFLIENQIRMNSFIALMCNYQLKAIWNLFMYKLFATRWNYSFYLTDGCNVDCRVGSFCFIGETRLESGNLSALLKHSNGQDYFIFFS